MSPTTVPPTPSPAPAVPPAETGDPELDVLAAALGTELHSRATRLTVDVPPVATVTGRSASRRRAGGRAADRRPIMALAAAAAVLVLLGGMALRRSGGDVDDVRVGGPSTTLTAPVPLRLTIDAPSLPLVSASDSSRATPATDGTATDGTATSGPPVSLDVQAPSAVHTATFVSPEVTAGRSAGGPQLSAVATVGGPAQDPPPWARSVPMRGRDASVTEYGTDLYHVEVALDGDVHLAVTTIGLPFDEVRAAIESVRVTSDDLAVAHVPDGLVAAPTEAGLPTSVTDVSAEATGTWAHLEVVTAPGSALASNRSLALVTLVPPADDVSRATVSESVVRGRPAWLVSQTVAGVTRFEVLWDEPDHRASVSLTGAVGSRTDLDALLSSGIHPVGEAAWSSILDRCARPELAPGVAARPPC